MEQTATFSINQEHGNGYQHSRFDHHHHHIDHFVLGENTMKEPYARRLEREALEKKIKTREDKVKYAENLRATYAQNMVNNDHQLDKDRHELDRARQELAAFNGGSALPPVVDFTEIVWGGK